MKRQSNLNYEHFSKLLELVVVLLKHTHSILGLWEHFVNPSCRDWQEYHCLQAWFRPGTVQTSSASQPPSSLCTFCTELNLCPHIGSIYRL